MAQVLDPNQNLIKLDNGQTINAQTGGWYDGQQYWGGTLSQPGQINTQSNQPGAGGLVSNEVIAQTNPANVGYIQQRRQEAGLTPSPATGVPQGQPTQTAQQTAQPAGAGIGDLTGVMGTAPSINLPDLYKSLYQSSGISDKQVQLNDLEKKYLEAKGKISDNPFADASMIDKRLQRLQQKYEAETTPLRDEIAMKKADIETQLNLQTKQFDIESEQAKTNLSRLNTLLEMGAFDNASGEDIASFTRGTGIPSSMIQSAIEARKAKNVKTQLITSTADSGEVTVTAVNADTSEIIKQTSLGMVGNAQTGSTKVSESERKRGVLSEVTTELERLGGNDKFVNPDEWNYLKQQWLMQGYSAQAFDDAFASKYVGTPEDRGWDSSLWNLTE